MEPSDFYHRYGKRAIDVALSSMGLVAISPLLGATALAIKLDSPGPVLFKQKRVGKGKELFEIYKFRSMRADTPADVPTHQLGDPSSRITKVGAFIRRTSIDELPQLINILKGDMSFVGPRPALWNQYDLIEERDRYGANDVMPGLTGWAQVNGRDELEIPVKARYDGEYAADPSLVMDAKCFLATIGSVLTSDGVVEGGTGQMAEEEQTLTEEQQDALVPPEKLDREMKGGAVVIGTAVASALAAGVISMAKDKKSASGSCRRALLNAAAAGFVGMASSAVAIKTLDSIKPKSLQSSAPYREVIEKLPLADFGNSAVTHKRILITGAGSYVGMNAERFLKQWPDTYEVETLDMLDSSWRDYDFSGYDVIFHVAGIAHADIGDATDEEKLRYYAVNTDLAVEVAKKAKAEGVGQFIFMSSMIVYGNQGHITRDTLPAPTNFYGDSKWQADQLIRELADDSFKVVVLRPPMIYGRGSKGNFPKLVKLAHNLRVFPQTNNRRSILYIGNFCNFLKKVIDNEESGVFFPQNAEIVSTSDIVSEVMHAEHGHANISSTLSLAVDAAMGLPGNPGELAAKAFRDSYYDPSMSEYKEPYILYNLRDSIRLSTGYEEDYLAIGPAALSAGTMYPYPPAPKGTQISVFIIGLRGYTKNYGGWETFVHGLIDNWSDLDVRFYAFEKVATPEEEGMDVVDGVTCIRLCQPNVGSATMPIYDAKSMDFAIDYIKRNSVPNPILFFCGIRIGPHVMRRQLEVRKLGIKMLENPAGIEWRRTKWGLPGKAYIYASARMMAQAVDCIASDSKAVRDVYDHMLGKHRPVLDYVSYGTYPPEHLPEEMTDKVREFFDEHRIEPHGYYLIVGRYVSENNYEMMIKGFMASHTKRRLVIVTNYETEKQSFHKHILAATHYPEDPRVEMVGTLYDQDILPYLRQYAAGYIHGHSVGGTNPGLLEGLSATNICLLFDVPFNKEVGGDAALYFHDASSLAALINRVDDMSGSEIAALGDRAKSRMEKRYSWSYIASEYSRLFHALIGNRGESA